MARVLLLFLISFSAFASEWSQEAKRLLPYNLQQLETGKTSTREAHKSLGKPQLVEGNKHYWETNGFKYGLELTFDKNQKLQKLHYTFSGKRPDLSLLKNFKSEDLLPVTQNGNVSSTLMKIQDKECEILIDISTKSIYSVRLP